MNPRRRFKSMIPTHDEPQNRRRLPVPVSAARKRTDKAAGASWLFADFLAACMSLPPDQWADME